MDSNHPQVKFGKTGVLLINLGTPDSTGWWDIRKYLNECTLYVTLEPCVMCAGASYWARIGRIVYGCRDNKRGYSQLSEKILHPKTEVVGGVMSEECSELIVDFFQKKR